MSIIKNLISKLVKNQKNPLGRWNIENCNKKIDKKIDLSNEDHCGPCGQYITDKFLKKKLPIPDKNIKPLNEIKRL